jgi:Na+/serine symporter
MKAIYSRAAKSVLAISAVALLAACGGGGGGGGSLIPTPPNVPGTDVPLAATQSSQAAFDFVSSIAAKGEANTDTPIALGDAVLASSEEAEPAVFAI